jgi:osmotically-inducible protein OsmY
MNKSRWMLTAGAMSAACLLAACSPDSGKTAGQNLDAAIATAKVKGEELKQNAKEGLAEAKVKGAELTQDAKQGLAEAKVAAADATEVAKAKASEAGDAMKDGTITASVKAELARDSDLSATAINVDTSDGKVVLRGTAPTQGAREKATMLAGGVKNVLSVDNQLAIAPNVTGASTPDSTTTAPMAK